MKVSKEAKIGLATIVTIGLFIWGFNFLKGKNIFTSTNTFYLVYNQLGGLKESNDVLINGYKVGQVTDLKLENDEIKKVVVKILVNKDYKIPLGSLARLSSIDFMGTKAIELILNNEMEYHQNGDTLKSKIGEGIMDKVADFEEKIMQITVGLEKLLDNLNNILNDEMNDKLHNTVNNLNDAIGNISTLTAENGEITLALNNINKLIFTINKSLQPLPNTMKNIKAVTDSLKEAQIKMLINNSAQVLENLNLIMAKVDRGEGTAGKLVNNDSLYVNLTAATKELELLLTDLREHPKKYVHFSVFGKKDE